MQFFFVGLAMRSQTHDYGRVHAALFGMAARRVSVRIWLTAIAGHAGEAGLESIGRSLAEGDEMLVVEVPRHLRSAQLLQAAA